VSEADAKAGNAPTTSRWRSFWVGLLIAVGCLAVVLGSVAVWLEYTALDTDEYVNTVAPLPSEPAVADAVSAFVVEEVVRETDAEAQLETALRKNLGPEAAKFSGVIASSIATRAEDAVAELIQSEQFGELWNQAHRGAHTLALAAIENDNEVLVETDGKVVLDLKPVIDQVVADISGETGVDVPVPEDIGSVELFEAGNLSEVQDTVNLLKTLAWLLPVVMLIAFALAIWFSRGRWRTVMQIGFGLIIAALLTAVILRFTRNQVIDNVADQDLPEDAVSAIWDVLIRNLENQTWIVLLVGVVAVATGAVMGDYDWAKSLRTSLAEQAESAEAQSALQRFARERTDLMRGIGVGVGILLLLLLPDPSILVALGIIAIVVLYLIGVEYLRKAPE